MVAKILFAGYLVEVEARSPVAQIDRRSCRTAVCLGSFRGLRNIGLVASSGAMKRLVCLHADAHVHWQEHRTQVAAERKPWSRVAWSLLEAESCSLSDHASLVQEALGPEWCLA